MYVLLWSCLDLVLKHPEPHSSYLGACIALGASSAHLDLIMNKSGGRAIEAPQFCLV